MTKEIIKRLYGLFIIIIVIVGLSVFLVPATITKAEGGQTLYQALRSPGVSCYEGDCSVVENAYAYQIILWKYDVKTGPIQYSNPVLVYDERIKGAFTIEYNYEMPSTYDSFKNSKWNGFSQKYDPDNDYQERADKNGNGIVFAGIGNNSNTDSHEHSFTVPTNPGEETEVTMDGYFYYSIDWNNPDYNCIFHDKTSKKFINPTFETMQRIDSGYTLYSQNFYSKNKRVVYKNVDLSRFKVQYKTTLNSYDDMDNYVKNIINHVKEKKPNKKGVAVFEEFFGATLIHSLSEDEIDKYYITIEPLERVLTGTGKKISDYYTQHFVEWERKPQNNYYPTAEYFQEFTECNAWTAKYTKNGTDFTSTGNYSSEGDAKNKCTNLKNSNCPKDSDCETDWKCSSSCINTYKYYRIRDVSQNCGIKQRFYFYGRILEGYSTLRPSREMGSSSFYLQRAVNACFDNAHCVLEDDMVTCKKDASGNNINQYYVGPDVDRAWVTTKSNGKDGRYEIKGMSGGKCDSSKPIPTDSYEGIGHYYVLDLFTENGCQEVCEKTGSKTSDKYLQCAENYCDSIVDNDLEGNPVKRKRKCILSCGYKYETTACNKNPYQKDAALPLESKSICNLRDGTKMQDVKGVLVTCEGDNLVGNDDKDTIFDQRKYISVACKETTSFEYKDVNHEKVFAGKGIDYFVNQNGKKECTYYFNTTQWKFDYATIPSKDLLRRQRLKYIYTTFNNAYDKTYDPTTKNEYHYPTHNPYPSQPVDSELDFAKEHYGEIEVQKYDLDKTLVTSRVTEIVENKIEPSASQTLVRKDEKETTTLSNVGKDTLVLIENYKNIPLEYVNKYVSTSTATASYKYKKACIATDGTSDVKYPDETVEVCHTIKSGTNYKDVLAKNVYYTNLKATPNEKFPADSGFAHYFETTAKVDAYYTNNEKCEYEIEDVPEKDNALGCVVNLTPDSGAEKLGYNVFKGGQVKAKVIITKNDLPKDDDIKNIYIKVNDKDYVEVNDEIVISKEKAGEAKEDFKVVAKVTTKKGKEYTALCENNFSLLKDSIGCTCVKKNDKLYEIIPNKTPREVMVSTLRNMKVQKVKESIVDNKYYVSLEEPLKNGNNIIGYVSDGSTITSCLCQGSETLRSCTEEFKPSKIGEITEYCYENYSKDINNYDSATDCISKCSNSCPNDQRNEKAVSDFCTANAISLGYDSINDCKNNCYNPYSEDGYLFRSIHNHDPFPNSPNSPYAQGNRGIGKNWYAKEEYITDDDNDKTSVTGDNANKQVEYIIDLNYNTIKMIRNENNNDGKEAYTTLIYSSTASDKNYVGEYKSKFLHDTLGGDIFKAESNKKSARYLPDDTEKQR